MFLKKFDMLSPPITLYYKGDDKHPSIFSAILTIIAYTIIFIFGVYYALEFINRENPTAYFFNRYIEDAGEFPLNASSMFAFIQFVDTYTNKPAPIDFTAFRILGFDEVQADTYILDEAHESPQQRHPHEFNHWLYGPCNNNTDTEGIGYLIDFDYFEQSACIRKYYDKSKGVYYNTGDPNFKWPVILRGCSHPDRTYYGIIMEKCTEDEAHKKSGYETCKTDDEINALISIRSINLQLIDQYADVLNYETPFKKYFYTVTGGITKDYYGINHINFNPAMMVTHNGIFFDNVIEEPSYFFTQNQQQSFSENTFGALNGFYFWMQNTLQYYERNYKRLQDILSDIGGISSIVLIAAEILNALCSGYIILLDTEDLVLSSENKNFNKNNLSRRPTIFKKADNILHPPKRQYYDYNNNDQRLSSNYQRLMRDGVDVYQNSNINDEKQEQFKNLYLKRNNIANNYLDNKDDENYISQKADRRAKRIVRSVIRGNNNNNNNIRPYRGRNDKKATNNKNTINKFVTEKNEESKKMEKQNFSWFAYMKFVICCGKNNPKIQYYDDFRNEIISEENILQYHLDIYKLLKACNIERNSIVPQKNPEKIEEDS